MKDRDDHEYGPLFAILGIVFLVLVGIALYLFLGTSL